MDEDIRDAHDMEVFELEDAIVSDDEHGEHTVLWIGDERPDLGVARIETWLRTMASL